MDKELEKARAGSKNLSCERKIDDLSFQIKWLHNKLDEINNQIQLYLAPKYDENDVFQIPNDFNERTEPKPDEKADPQWDEVKKKRIKENPLCKPHLQEVYDE